MNDQHSTANEIVTSPLEANENLPIESLFVEKKEKPNPKKEIFSWIMVVVFAFVAAIVMQNFVIVNATIPTGSMIATINEGDRVMANRLSYLGGAPARGDVVIFRLPDDESLLYVKRIIGLPGDVVELRAGKVHLNGAEAPLEEPYITQPSEGNFGPYQVPADSYFMLGDNRNNSKDSRFWDITYVTSDKILGKVIFRYYPEWTWFSNPA